MAWGGACVAWLGAMRFDDLPGGLAFKRYAEIMSEDIEGAKRSRGDCEEAAETQVLPQRPRGLRGDRGRGDEAQLAQRCAPQAPHWGGQGGGCREDGSRERARAGHAARWGDGRRRVGEAVGLAAFG